MTLNSIRLKGKNMENNINKQDNIPKGIKKEEIIPIRIKEKKQKSQAVMTAKGGTLVRGRRINKDSPLALSLTACSVCNLGKSCEDFDKKGYCKYQIETLKASHRMQDALISGDPVDFLTNLQTGIARLEADVEYKKKIEGKPCLNEQKEVLFLKMQLFEMTHGKAKPVAQVNINAPVVDMRAMLDELRKKEVKAEYEVKEE